MRKNKIAQMGIYSLFVAFFTVFALSYALINLNDARKITDSNGKNLVIGEKQFAVFASLQDADGVNIFLDQASEIASQKALEKMRESCFNNPSTEHVVDEWISPCGKYIYPMWSSTDTLCLPDCETAFTNAFKESFLGITTNYYKGTGVELPLSYNFTVDKKEDYFLLHGISSSDAGVNVLSMEARLKSPVSISTPYVGGKFSWPVQAGSKIISSCFGPRILNGENDLHPAIDIPAAKGTPVLAAAYGQVVVANPCNGRVVISHGSGINTEYLHMDSINVKVNDKVNQRQQIGTVGGKGDDCSDNAYPAHIHFAVIFKGVSSGLKFGSDKMVLPSYGTDDRVQPLCFLETPDAQAGTGCDAPINTQLEEVCAKYNLPMPSSSSSYAGLSSLADVYKRWGTLISEASQMYGVSECQILAHIYQESRGNPNAISPVGAAGLMQLMPATARELGLNVPDCDWVNSPGTCDKNSDQRFNPELNIRAGTRYLTIVQSRVNNNCNSNFAIGSQQVMAGYNGGPNRKVLCSGTLEDYVSESRNYVIKVTANMQACQASNTITGGATSASSSATAGTPFGIYNFKPSFTVRVNKEFNDSVKPLSDWFRKTWEDCIDDPKVCINDKMKEFNNQSFDYKLSFANKCEEYPLFYDMVELIQDCFSNKTFGCMCEFNFSKAFSPGGKDLAIRFDTINNNISLLVKNSAGTYEVKDSYILYKASIKPGVSSHTHYVYFMKFNPDTYLLENARLAALSAFDDEATTTYTFDDYKIMKISKTSPTEGLFTDSDTMSKCSYYKDRFRLCAKPIPEKKDALIELKFALQLKDKPPEPVVKEEVVVTPLSKDNSAVSNSLMDQILGMVIPGFGIFEDLISGSLIPDSQEAGLQVAMKVPKDKNGNPLDIAGYEVYCNDFLTDFLEKQFLDNFNPNQFVVTASNALGQRVSQLDPYVKTNPYSDFLSKKDCNVPVTKSNGETVSVPGVKGIYQNGTMVFNINKCGAASVMLDKFIKKDYCVTLIPVDKNGNKMNDYAVSNCAKTNSIMDMVVGDLIKQELGSFIPSGLIPDSLQPYIKLPDSSQIFDAVTGKRDFNLVSMVNTENLNSLLQEITPEFISSVTNNEILSGALISSVDGMNMWEKQEVLNTIAGQISNEDAQMLFTKVISGGDLTDAATSMAFEKGVDYIDGSKAPEILKQVVNGENSESLAYNELIKAANEELVAYDKKEALIDVAKSSSGSDVRDKIIEKAVNKGCAASYGIDVDEAVVCLRDDEISELYSEVLSDYQTSDSAKQALLNKAVDRLGDRAPSVLKKVVMQRDLSGVAYEMVQSELSNMPDYAKSQFVTDILQGGMVDSDTLQTELFKMIPSIDNSIIPNLLSDGNINSLLGDALKSALEGEVNSFVQGECTPVTG
jgi:hypothetical protein